jgi:uncharacterized membrane protein
MSRATLSGALLTLALMLLSPLAGLSLPGSDSGLHPASGQDASRTHGPYSVDIYPAGENSPGDDQLTRNQSRSFEFTVENTGNDSDTYDITAVWTDSNNLGWNCVADVASVSLAAGATASVEFTFSTPRAGVYDGAEKLFKLNATSTNETSVSDSEDFNIRIDMSYAVDLTTRGDAARSAERGGIVRYQLDLTNVGDNGDSYRISLEHIPWDWSGSPTETNINNVAADEMRSFYVDIDVPDSAEEDEYALITVLVTSKTSSYSHIDAVQQVNTTVTDGRTYGLTLTVDDGAQETIPGKAVSYSLTLRNDGNEPDSFALDASALPAGWSSSVSPDSVADLVQGDTADISFSVTPPTDAEEDDWAAADVSAWSTGRNHHRDSAATNTSVRIPVSGVSLSSDAAGKDGTPGTTVSFTLTLENTGSDPDSYDLSLTKPPTWDISLSQVTVEDLANGGSVTITLSGVIPGFAHDTDSADATVTATSRGNSSVSQAIMATFSVDTVYSMLLSVDGWQRTANPGNSTTFSFTVTNLGNGVEDFTIDHTTLPVGWDVNGLPHADLAGVSAYGGTASFQATLTVPDDETPGWNNFTVSVAVKDNPSLEQLQAIAIEVENFAAMTVAVDPAAASGDPGATASYTFSITNTGNSEDTFDFYIDALPSGWQAQYRISDGGAYVSQILVPVGETRVVDVFVTTLASDGPGERSLTLTVRSGLNHHITRDSTLSLTIAETHGLEVTTGTTAKDGGSNEAIPFSFTVRNNGNALDYVSLPIPTPPLNWEATLSDTQFTLTPGASKTVYLNLRTPEGVWGGSHTIMVTINSDETGEKHTLNFTVTIPASPGLTVMLVQKNNDIKAGEDGSFTFNLSNTGNTYEQVSLKVQGKYSSWFNLPQASVNMAPGDTREITVIASPPGNTPSMDTTASFSATLSSNGESILKSLTLSIEGAPPPPPTDDGDEGGFSIPGPGLLAAFGAAGAVALLRRRR